MSTGLPSEGKTVVNAAGGGWTAENYGQFSDLPVIQALHSTVAATIRKIAKTCPDQCNVLSLGIGRGGPYPQLLPELSNLHLTGMDLEETMVTQCRERLTAVVQASCKPDRVVLKQGNIRDVEIPEGTNVIEATLALHHIHEREALLGLFHRCYEQLPAGGVMVLGEIDVEVASRVAEERSELERQYETQINIDLGTGEFVWQDSAGEEQRRRLLDPKDARNKAVLLDMWERSGKGLWEEMRRHVPSSELAVREQRRTMFVRRTEAYRSADNWADLLREAGFTEITVISADEMRQLFPDLRDSPCLVIAKK